MTFWKFVYPLVVLCFLLMPSHAFNLDDKPVLKYGTAWKKEETATLVHQAIKAGFRHIDTACQPRHYREDLVGEGWKSAAKEMNLTREDLWLQTKFSGLGAHSEDNIPYDRDAPLETRVRQSLAKSLQNLQTDYIDSWVMHGPENNWDDHFRVWNTMEEAIDDGKVLQLGLSNFYRLEDVKWAYDHARIKPKVIQNRFYSDAGHDVDIRAFCKENDVEYQSFWTLTANPDAYRHPEALELAKNKGLSPEGVSNTYYCLKLFNSNKSMIKSANKFFGRWEALLRILY